ncbi:hypothetical protein [Albirhodobacter sp. R86504]|uniref:hypothetical protein n=1 Tax=Albirhodobacter sp. R86504 TaxID=3093848 RepID=UPI0036706C21
MLDIIMGLIAPHLAEIISGIVTALLAFIAAQIKARTGAELDANARDALHSALTTGAMLAIARYGRTAGVNQEAMVAEAVNYAKASVPDAIKRLGPVETVLADLAVAKIEGVGRGG